MISRKEKGYTLVEILIVVSIMTITLPIITKSYLDVLHQQQLNGFIKELKTVLYDAQVTAIATGDYTKVVIDQTRHEVLMMKGVSNRVSTYSYSKSIEVNCGIHGCYAAYAPNGHIRNPGTIFFSLKQENYKLVLLLGQGRFYVKKL